MESAWTYSLEDGKERGPVPLAELLRLLATGSITLRTLVKNQDMGESMPLSAIDTIRQDVLAALKSRGGGAASTASTTRAAAPETPSLRLPAAAARKAGDVAVPATDERRAGFWRRSVAVTIDIVIVGGALFLLGLGMQAFFFDVAVRPVPGRGIPDAAAALVVVAWWLYCALMECSRERATLGKIVLDLRVTDIHGDKVSFARASVRFIAKTLSILTLGVPYLLGVLGSRKQPLHDWIAGCKVVVVTGAVGTS